jgi:hypothetical protein
LKEGRRRELGPPLPRLGARAPPLAVASQREEGDELGVASDGRRGSRPTAPPPPRIHRRRGRRPPLCSMRRLSLLLGSRRSSSWTPTLGGWREGRGERGCGGELGMGRPPLVKRSSLLHRCPRSRIRHLRRLILEDTDVVGSSSLPPRPGAPASVKARRGVEVRRRWRGGEVAAPTGGRGSGWGGGRGGRGRGCAAAGERGVGFGDAFILGGAGG